MDIIWLIEKYLNIERKAGKKYVCRRLRMLYNDSEMILFSLIYSDVQAGRFARPYLTHKNLYGIFTSH